MIEEGICLKETHSYLVPDYFPGFSCKMGACRAACCVGWPISFTMKDYFRLLGIDCSPDLRRKLDVAMKMVDHPTEEQYAQISPRYDGQCPMRMEDGRCAMQAELGNEALAAVCSLYPRGLRTEGDYECSCANSCEAVLEMLLHRGPIRFLPHSITCDLPPAAQRGNHFETVGRAQSIRLWLISLMQDQRYPLAQRLLLLGEGLHAMDEALSAKDEARVVRLLDRQEGLPAPSPVTPGSDQLHCGLEVAGRLLEMIDEQSVSIRDYGQAALAYFLSGSDPFLQYQQAEAHFSRLIPDWPQWFENMLVNHMFFTQFPFQDRPVDLKDEYIALCVVYALLRFLCIGWTADKEDPSAAVDVAAAAFRLIDHTEFDRYAAPMLKRLGYEKWHQLQHILCL